MRRQTSASSRGGAAAIVAAALTAAVSGGPLLQSGKLDAVLPGAALERLQPGAATGGPARRTR